MKFKHEDFKTVPEELRSILNGLREYRPGNPFPPNYGHDDIASELSQGSHPLYSIVVFEEILAPEHRNDKRFVKIRREKIISELDEKVSRVFDREINERMAEHLKEHRDPEDKYLHDLLKEYYPAALRMIREEYKEMYPRSWKRKFDKEKISRPRTVTRRDCIYDMPEPLCHWDTRNLYQQYFVMPGHKAICQGGGAGSSQRETQSKFGFAFAVMDRQRPVPTHILVYDRNNRLLFVDTFDRLCLVPNDMGSNYDLPFSERKKLLENVLKVTVSGEIGTIETISVSRGSSQPSGME